MNRQDVLGPLLVGALLLAPQPAFPWSDEGHRIIGQLADHRLHEGAAARVRELVGPEGLAGVATWADQIKAERPETRPWHYVDIPLGRHDYEPGRDCATPRPGDCLIGALERWLTVLRAASTDNPTKAEALKFITHFVGDLHQPLHCIDNDDRGGNEVLVSWFGGLTDPFTQKPWNLHAVWDAALIERAGVTRDRYVKRLEGWLDSHNPAELEKGSVRDWALETHRAAEAVAYGLLPADRKIGEGYYRQALPAVNALLAKAGVRLAGLLNRAFEPRR